MSDKTKAIFKKIKSNFLSYSVAIAIPLAIGIASAALTRDSMGIYEKLNVPPLAPPPLIFPIVWSALFVLMGISSALVFTNRERYPEATKSGLIFYSLSLIVNFGWSIVFFNLQAAFFAFLVLLLLFYLIIKTIFEYRKVSPIAAYLQIPYAIWVIFAGYLNCAIWLLNQ